MNEMVSAPPVPKGPAAFPPSGAVGIVRDRQVWDDIVAAHSEAGGFLQSWTWGRFKQHFSWAPTRLALPAGVGKPAPVAQVLFRRVPYSPYTIGYIQAWTAVGL